MSAVTVSIGCTGCHQLLPSSLFIRNQQSNTFYKTCHSCRTRRKDRRQILRRQQAIAPLPPVVEEFESNDSMIFLFFLNGMLIFWYRH